MGTRQQVGTPAQVVAKTEPPTLIQFNVAKLITKFNGDLREQGVLQKFSNWKSAWMNLVQEMKTFRGFNYVILFQKLKNCLDGPALELVSKYSCESVNSYEAAMKDLLFKFEDPIELAGSYLTDALAPRESLAEQCEAMRHAFNALHNMEDVFEREGVKMYDFAIIQNLTSALSSEGQGKWKSYKARKRQEYRLKADEAAKSGEPMPIWKEGMVQNYEQFNAWLQIQAVRMDQSSSVVNPPQADTAMTAANFSVLGHHRREKPISSQCPIGDGKHSINHCPKGLAMTQTDWFHACRRAGICAKCSKPFASGHQCQGACSLCRGKGGDRVAHFIVMCPLNKYRTAPLVVANSDKSGTRTKKERDKIKRTRQFPPTEAPTPKWVKNVEDKIRKLADQMEKKEKVDVEKYSKNNER